MSRRKRYMPKTGDRVQYNFLGKIGFKGTVVSVHPKRLKTGGSRALVKVLWDNGHTGTVEERALVCIELVNLKAVENMRRYYNSEG